MPVDDRPIVAECRFPNQFLAEHLERGQKDQIKQFIESRVDVVSKVMHLGSIRVNLTLLYAYHVVRTSFDAGLQADEEDLFPPWNKGHFLLNSSAVASIPVHRLWHSAKCSEQNWVFAAYLRQIRHISNWCTVADKTCCRSIRNNLIASLGRPCPCLGMPRCSSVFG